MLLMLLAVPILVVAFVCCLAIVSHRRITEQALDRALPEDVPGMLETSGQTLTDLLNSLRMRVQRMLPGGPNGGMVGPGSADGGVPGEAGPGAEGAGQ
ncbi:hypothetical protein GTZ78_10585 [Streptomyces sp. SID8361]|uniref:hypothetical protein n=1 Tax=Streptomyces sp. MnatMP-M27 TaxID=1839768 RepID=UPI00081EEA52|nr:hypothetical protein [Streptomyces sp. MnatMP-M27]MYU11125.1 hypothetical protein [Streptomyces sp. SID8361]SCF78534.1 hypothetical protein GA0115260_102453 [Streptomyces sp. MnatMP-M27]